MAIGAKGSGTTTCLTLTSGATAAVADADEARLRYNTSLNRAEISEDGGAYVPIVGGGVVATISALAATDEAPLTDGTMVAMKSLMCAWQLDKTSAIAADGITVIATLSGVGRWIRVPGGSEVWRKQTTWYIDAAAGNDEAAGGLATPIESWEEFERRMNGQLGDANYTVNILGTAYATNIAVKSRVFSGRKLTIVGTTSSPIYSGSVTAYQAWNTGARTECQITDAAIPVSWTASGLVGKMIVLTSGANSGAKGFVVEDLGAKVCRAHMFVKDSHPRCEPSVGNTFNVVNCTTAPYIAVSDDIGGTVEIRDLFLTEALFSGATVQVTNVKQDGGYQQWGGYVSRFGGLLEGASQTSYGGVLELYAISINNGGVRAYCGSRCRVLDQCLAVGDVSFDVRDVSYMQFSDSVAFFGVTTDVPLMVRPGGVATLSAILWGTGNTTAYAITVQSDGTVVIDGAVTPDILGAGTADTIIGGTTKTFADFAAGFVHATNLAKSVVLA